MNNLWKTTKYLLGSLVGMIIIGSVSILANAIFADIILYFNQKNGMMMGEQTFGNLEGTAAVFVVIVGIIFFYIQFKVLLANGVSRKTFFWANLPIFAVISAIFALFITLVTILHRFFIPMITVSQKIYTGTNLFDSTIIQFAAYFFCGVLGWLIFLAYYRSNAAMRWVITLAPFGLVGLLFVLDSAVGGKISLAIGEFLSAVMGFAGSVPNPYIGVLSLLVLAAGINWVNYLLIRRAPLKG
ncbi:MAG: hypothetical protein CVU39_13050 [Chloroflexi bacterium HGW-Chloroflexi-10]|nr:MAG: hypothetical protein CVU39_13050 [Chloroflexi bacterium HGW-Chloroflexi-10]